MLKHMVGRTRVKRLAAETALPRAYLDLDSDKERRFAADDLPHCAYCESHDRRSIEQ